MEEKMTALDALNILLKRQSEVEKYGSCGFNMTQNRECLVVIEKALNTLELFKNALRLNTTQTEIGVTRDVEGNATISYDTNFEFIKKTLDEEYRKVLREWVLENACPKEVEALKIIKEKGLHYLEAALIQGNTSYEDYCNEMSITLGISNRPMIDSKIKTKEEYNLLKEVL